MVKAHMELPDVESVRRAVGEMNQRKVCGLRMKVDVPYFLPSLRAQVLGVNPVGPNHVKHLNVTGESLATVDSPRAGCRGSFQLQLLKEASPHADKSIYTAPHLLGVLQDLAEQRVRVRELLQTAELPVFCGDEVEVVVTHVVSDSLFMGTPVCEDVLERLQEVCEEMSAAAENLPPVPVALRQDFEGPCIVRRRADHKWHRACLWRGQAHTRPGGGAYLLDVGVTQQVDWACVRRYDDPKLWGLPPLALPFSLTDPVVNLKNRLHSRITLMVTAYDQDGIVTAKAVSLVSHWKELLNLDTVILC
ncbi:uncharacterized protein LOC143282353 isoform X2 [Babylonia areolata]